jgi:hypothetical protein
MRGPVTPVCIVGRPCSKPAVGVTLVFRGTGGEVRKVRTGMRGTYRIVLSPDTYVVNAFSKGPVRLLRPSNVSVDAGAFRRVNFYIDTGIR